MDIGCNDEKKEGKFALKEKCSITNLKPPLHSDLVKELNELLSALSLPITLESPQDLTPSLLIAILESILQERLPISSSIRDSKTPTAKMEAMKIFLGVLEDDILQRNIGLSDMDPRKLAAGEWDEIIFVGQTLCLLGRQYLLTEGNNTKIGCDSSYSGFSHDIGYLPYGETETAATTALTQELHTPTENSSPQPLLCIHDIDIPGLSIGVPFENDQNDGDLPENNLFETPRGDSSSSVRYDGFLHCVSDNVQEYPKRMRSRSSHNTTPSSHVSQVFQVLVYLPYWYSFT